MANPRAVWREVDALTPTHEAWAGGFVSRGVASVWYGYGYAPRSLLEPNDWRFRTVVGATAYRDRGTVDDLIQEARRLGKKLPDLDQPYDPDVLRTVTKLPTAIVFGDVLAGYQWRFGSLNAKAFGGLTAMRKTYVNQKLDTLTVETSVGAKAAAEFWLNIGPYAFAKLDLWTASAGPQGSADARLGVSVLPWLSLGPEARLLRYNGTRDDVSYGGFARFAWPTGEIVASAGWSVDDAPRGAGSGPYVGLSFLGRY